MDWILVSFVVVHVLVHLIFSVSNSYCSGWVFLPSHVTPKCTKIRPSIACLPVQWF